MSEIDAIVDALADEISDRIAARVLEQLEQWRAADVDAWMTLKQCAAYLGMTEEAIRKRHDLPRSRWGGRILYRRSLVDQYLDSLRES